MGEIAWAVKVAVSNMDCNISFKPTVRCCVLSMSQEPKKV